MTIIRSSPDSDNPISYVATVAILCCVSCVAIMLKFGFRARIHVASKRTKDENVPVVCISGSYRANREEFFESGIIAEPPKKISPSMVKLPLNNNGIKPSKSTSDIREPDFLPVNVSKSTPDISFDPRGGRNNRDSSTSFTIEVELRNPDKNRKALKKEEKVQVKLDKKQQAEQKAREKVAQKQEKERMKQEKERVKQENKEQKAQEKEQAKQEKARNKIAKTKTVAPRAPPLPRSPQPQTSSAPTPPTQLLPRTNTLQSDINRSSGPPPYSELPDTINSLPANPVSGSTSNVSFGKPIDNTPSSWDMVTQHRQQMIRPTTTIGGGKKKQMVMDLNYNFNNNVVDNNNEENCEA